MTALTSEQVLDILVRAWSTAPGYGDAADEHGVFEWMNTAAAALATAAAPEPWTWTPPAEPGPHVRRLRPVERYRGDNATWFDRTDDGAHWRCFLRGRPGEPMAWLHVIAAAGQIYGGRTLVDATAERDAEDLAARAPSSWSERLAAAKAATLAAPRLPGGGVDVSAFRAVAAEFDATDPTPHAHTLGQPCPHGLCRWPAPGWENPVGSP